MRNSFSFAAGLVFALALPGGLNAQTAIDLKSQSRNIDFSAASTTRPFKTGTVLPAACVTGESFFKTNAPAGQNLFGCTAANTWTVMSSGLADTGVAPGVYGSSSLVPQITIDAQGRITSASQIGISGGGGGLPAMTSQTGKFLFTDGTNALWQPVTLAGVQDCTASLSGGTMTVNACGARNGNLDVSAASCTATLTGTSASGIVYGYLSGDGTFQLGHASAATLTCTGWTTATGVSAFPADALPLFTAAFASNVWTIGGVTPYRRMVGRDAYSAGDGMISLNNPATGVTTLHVDPAQIPRYFNGAGAPAQNCAQGRDFYLDTTALSLYHCRNTNTWSAVGSGGGGGAAITVRRYPVWGWLQDNNGNNTTAFSANETRWHQFHLPAAMTAAGVGLRATAGIGAGKGLRFAIADTSGAILYKTAVNTSCAGALCEAAFSSAVTLSAGVYYLGVTTDSTSLQTAQVKSAGGDTVMCALSNAGTSPAMAGSGTTGSGTGAAVDFGASMGALTTYACSPTGTNVLAGKFHDMYLY